jgi:hypothetical protein
VTRSVARVADAEVERVGAGGPDDPLSGQRLRAASTSAVRPSSAAR